MRSRECDSSLTTPPLADLFFDIYSPTNWSALMNEGYLAAVQIINSEAPGNGSLHERSSDLTSSRYVSLIATSRRCAHLIPLSGDSSSASPTTRRHIVLPLSGVQTTWTCKARRWRTSSAASSRVRATSRTSVSTQGTLSVHAADPVYATVGAGWYSQFYLCSFWPVRSVERYQGPFDKTLANKIIIGSNTVSALASLLYFSTNRKQYDPITTLAGAQRLAGLLGNDAALVRLNGFGVGVHFR